MEKENNTGLFILISVIVLLFVIVGAGMGGFGMMGFGMGFGFIFMIIFLGLLIWVIVRLIDSGHSGKFNGEDALTILKKRYASGEIPKKKYDDMKKEILR